MHKMLDIKQLEDVIRRVLTLWTVPLEIRIGIEVY